MIWYETVLKKGEVCGEFALNVYMLYQTSPLFANKRKVAGFFFSYSEWVNIRMVYVPIVYIKKNHDSYNGRVINVLMEVTSSTV